MSGFMECGEWLGDLDTCVPIASQCPSLLPHSLLTLPLLLQFP